MPRPIKPRWVEFLPGVTYFKPAGVPLSVLDEVALGIDELEALRLKHVMGLDQEECAKRMKVAQSTFQRILASAHSKVASALVEGKAIRIGGGHYRFPFDSNPGAKEMEPGEPVMRDESPGISATDSMEPGHGRCWRGGRGRNRGNGW